MGATMIVTRLKITKAQRQRARHARMWQLMSVDARANHFVQDCGICDQIYGPLRGVNRRGVIHIGGVEVH